MSEKLTLRELLGTDSAALVTEREFRDQNFCRYERLVIRSLRRAGIIGNVRSANCNDSNAPDADMVIGDEIYYVEVKASDHARMGSASVGYSYLEREFYSTGLNVELSELVVSLIETSSLSLKKSLDRLVRAVAVGSPDRKRVLRGFPMSGFTAGAWASAREGGWLQPLNSQFEGSIDIIGSHYARKGVSYIQVGGRGLFYLSSNPANLPVPKLEGTVVLEVTVSKAGDIPGRETSRAAIRVHPRIEISGESPYTLDDPASIIALIAAMENVNPLQGAVQSPNGISNSRARRLGATVSS